MRARGAALPVHHTPAHNLPWTYSPTLISAGWCTARVRPWHAALSPKPSVLAVAASLPHAHANMWNLEISISSRLTHPPCPTSTVLTLAGPRHTWAHT